MEMMFPFQALVALEHFCPSREVLDKPEARNGADKGQQSFHNEDPGPTAFLRKREGLAAVRTECSFDIRLTEAANTILPGKRRGFSTSCLGLALTEILTI
jgi:hypothetical protein